MNHTERTTGQLARLLSALLLAAAEVKAEELAGATRRIVVSIPDRKLVLVEGERIVKMYDVAVGKPSTPSPQGQYSVVNRIPHPHWYGPKGVVAPGDGNPLGTRWLGLSVAGYGIHGTNRPLSIGQAASHGCIRMRNRDVEELFELVQAGVTVELAGERPVWFPMKGDNSNAVTEVLTDSGGRGPLTGSGNDPRL